MESPRPTTPNNVLETVLRSTARLLKEKRNKKRCVSSRKVARTEMRGVFDSEMPRFPRPSSSPTFFARKQPWGRPRTSARHSQRQMRTGLFMRFDDGSNISNARKCCRRLAAKSRLKPIAQHRKKPSTSIQLFCMPAAQGRVYRSLRFVGYISSILRALFAGILFLRVVQHFSSLLLGYLER